MQANDFNPAKFKELRKQAEAKLRQKLSDVPEKLDDLSPEQARRLFHELQVYQEELKIQNEDLLRAQQELERSRLHYFDLYELAPAGYLTLDGWGIIREANLTASKLLGVARDKLVGEAFARFIAAEEQDSYYLRCKEAIKAGFQQAWELRMVRYGGAIFWAQVEMSATGDRENGGPASPRRLVIMDITERKQAEAALQQAHDELEQKVAERTADLTQANEKYHLLVENTTDLIYSFDRELRLTFVNQSVCEAIGAEPHEIMGKSHDELGYTEETNMKWKDMLHQALSGKTVEGEHTTPMPDGTTRIYWNLLMPVFDQEGNVTGITGASRDLTVRKRMEEEIRKGDKLDALGILAGGIAHDFNNYLATLLANIGLAKLYKNDLAKIEEKMENMEKATLRAKDLSNKLFTFAQGGAPQKEKISVNQLIVDDITFALSGTKVLPRFYIKEDLFMLEADGGQLSQVLNNLTINAVQAMPEGGTLEIRAENIELPTGAGKSALPLPDGPYIKITITDEGTGIPQKYLKKIFDPFFTTKDRGRGLGLATSYSIIKKHGGHIHVESDPGVGTTFAIFLPSLTAAEKPQPDGEAVLQGSGKILIMDDEEDLLTAAGEGLSALGYDVTLSRDGEQAIELYSRALEQNEPFQLVILDLTIPGGTGGKQAMEELLRLEPEVKAIVTSGYSNDPVMSGYRDYGFKGKVMKPFTMEELSKTVREVIG